MFFLKNGMVVTPCIGKTKSGNDREIVSFSKANISNTLYSTLFQWEVKNNWRAHVTRVDLLLNNLNECKIKLLLFMIMLVAQNSTEVMAW